MSQAPKSHQGTGSIHHQSTLARTVGTPCNHLPVPLAPWKPSTPDSGSSQLDKAKSDKEQYKKFAPILKWVIEHLRNKEGKEPIPSTPNLMTNNKVQRSNPLETTVSSHTSGTEKTEPSHLGPTTTTQESIAQEMQNHLLQTAQLQAVGSNVYISAWKSMTVRCYIHSSAK